MSSLQARSHFKYLGHFFFVTFSGILLQALVNLYY